MVRTIRAKCSRGVFEPLEKRVQYLHWALTIAAGIHTYDRAVLFKGEFRVGDAEPMIRGLSRVPRIYPTGDYRAAERDLGSSWRSRQHCYAT